MANPFTMPQTTAARLTTDHAQTRVRLSVTPLGLLAIGGLVAAILLSIPPIIRAAGDARTPGS